MSDSKPEVLVVTTKRKPPIWSVKVGVRYVTSFYGADAKRCAIEHALNNYGSYSIRELPIPSREENGRSVK